MRCDQNCEHAFSASSRSGRVSEVDLAAIVAEHFRVRGYAVYQEVNLGGRCDLVARYHRLAYAIEVRQSANLAVLAQAVGHIGRAHGVYVAVPVPRMKKLDEFCDVAEACGLGVLRVWRQERATFHHDREAEAGVEECVTPRLQRWLDSQHELWLTQTLTKEHEALGGVAGSTASQAAWTGFRQFQREVWQVLRRYGPMTVKDLAVRLREDKRYYAHFRWPSDALARRALHGYLTKNLLPCLARDDGRPAKWSAIGEEFKAA